MAAPPTARLSYKMTYVVLLLGVTAYALLLSMVFPALPAIQHALHTSAATATWVLTIYLLSASVATPIIGRIGDKVGKERMLVVALGALAVGSVIAGLAPNIQILLLGRAVQGIGGGVLPLAFGIIRDEFPKERVGFAVGFTSAILAVGSGIGTIAAGPIVLHLGWRWLFWIPLGMVIIAAVMAHLFVPESPVRTPGRINWFAAVLLALWLVCLLVGVSEAPKWGWGSTRVLGLLVGAVVFLVVWVRYEWRSPEPLIDMRMMKRKAVSTNNTVAFLIGFGMYSSGAILPEFIQSPRSLGYGFGATITMSSVYMLPQLALMFVFGLWSGGLSERFGAKPVLVAGVGVSALGYSLLALLNSTVLQVMTAAALLGMGFGLAFSALAHLIVQAVPDTQTGAASGMNANIRTIGGAIGAAIVSSIVAATLQASGYPTKAGYTLSFGFMAVTTIGGLIAAIFVPRPTGEFDHPEEHQYHAEIASVAGATIVD